MLKPGDSAPDFELPDADMEIVRLSDFRGKNPVVLYFYLRDNTPGCTTQAIEFSDLEAEFRQRGCVVMGVSRDDCISHGEFRDRHGISVRLLADRDSAASDLYGVLVDKEVDGVMRKSAQRASFIIDPAGVIRHAFYGIPAKGHAAQVLELIKEL